MQQETSPEIARELERFLALQRDYPQRPAKLLRGRLLLLSAEAHGAVNEAARARANTLAQAIELFQNWVLVHDDIEDLSLERRGSPALHELVGVPVALNVGDAMHAAMWRHLVSLRQEPDFDAQRALNEFASIILRTAAGQHLDLAWVASGRFDVTEEEYLTMVSMKTAYYTVVGPLRLGAMAAGREPSPLLEEAGLELGVAFQIRDDVLNLTPGAVHGKEFAGDLYEGKRTLILAHFLRVASGEERAAALALLAKARAEKNSHDVNGLQRLMEARGSLRYAQNAAEERLKRGVELLAAALEPLPGARARSELLNLVGGLASRES